MICRGNAELPKGWADLTEKSIAVGQKFSENRRQWLNTPENWLNTDPTRKTLCPHAGKRPPTGNGRTNINKPQIPFDSKKKFVMGWHSNWELEAIFFKYKKVLHNDEIPNEVYNTIVKHYWFAFWLTETFIINDMQVSICFNILL